jgi:imidazolonepropionase-like amidohydrolase
MRKIVQTFVLFLISAATVLAQQAQQPTSQVPTPVQPPKAGTAQQPAPARRIVVRAARMLDVRSGQMVANPVIVIEGDRIVSIGGQAPQGAELIDLGNATLLPGLMDMHTHLTFEPQLLGYQGLGISPQREALFGAKNAKLTLEAGFTVARNVGAGGFSDVALRDAIEAGDVPGPRLLVSGPSMGITGGHCDDNLLPYEYHSTSPGIADGPAAVQHKVRELIKYGASVIKVCATGGVLSRGTDPRTSQVTREELQMLVSEAHRLGRTVAAHAHGGEGIIWASEAGVDSIEHGSYLDDAGIAVMKKNGTYLVPTLYLMDWFLENAERVGMPDYGIRKGREVLPIARKNFARAVQQGVKVAFGTDSAVYPHGLNGREFAVYVRLGMTPLAAIQSATLNTADLIKMSDRLGTLEPNKLADIIAVDGNPLDDISTLERVKFVMKGGRVYKNDYKK